MEKKIITGTPAERVKLHGGDTLRTHLFLCGGPRCAGDPANGVGDAAWAALKAACKRVDPDLGQARVYRTRVGCLRVCTQGPILLAYPQGRWYNQVTADQVDGLVDHILSGSDAPHPLEFHRHPLPAE